MVLSIVQAVPRITRLGTVPVLAAIVLLGACGGAGGDGVTDEADTGETPVVIATTSIWADIVSHVACDASASVSSIIPAGIDAHAFEPSLQDRATLGKASLVLSNGLSLEEGLLDTLEAVASDGVTVIAASDSIDTIDHDPHVWQDPTRVASFVPVLEDALVRAGVDADQAASCTAGYLADLDALDVEVAALLADVEPSRRVLVTNHDSLRYFADRYGLTVLGAVIPSASTLGETNPADLEVLATAIADHDVATIFAEEQHSRADVDALAQRVGDVDVVTLFTDALGPPGSGADTYVGLIRTNAELIAAGIGG